MEHAFLLCVDLRFPGGTSSAVLNEIRALADHPEPQDVGILCVESTVFPDSAPANQRLVDALCASRFPVYRFDQARNLFVDWKTEPLAPFARQGRAPRRLGAHTLIAHSPYVALNLGKLAGRLSAELALVVCHQPYFDSAGVPYYSAADVVATVKEIATEVRFVPIGATVRAGFAVSGWSGAYLAGFDWPNVFDFNANSKSARASGLRPDPQHSTHLIVGRHSRPEWPKWPNSKEEFKQIYQYGTKRRVRFLGWGPCCDAMFKDDLPQNWECRRFNEIDPAVFLQGIEAFVYFHHSNWIEGFGRTVAEAMASGLPCILTPALEPTFGGAALYAAPEEVGSLLARLDECRGELDRWTATVRELAAGAFGLHRIQRVYEQLGAAVPAHAERRMTFADVEMVLADDQARHRRALDAGYDLQSELGLMPRSRPCRNRQRGEVIELPGAAAEDAGSLSTDFAIYMDLRSARSDLWRTIELAESLHQAGYAVSIVHVETTLRGDFDSINPLVDELSCGIRVYGRPGDTPLRYLEIRRGMVIAAPQRLLGPDGRPLFDSILRPITPGVAVLVDKQQRPEWYRLADDCLALICGVQPRWISIGFPASAISQVVPQAEEAPELLAFVAARTPIRDRELLKHLCGRTGPRRGRIGLVDATQWQSAGDDIAENFGDEPIFVYATPSWRLAPEPLQHRPEIHVFRAAEISFTRFLEKVDLVTYFPAEQPSDQLLIPLLRAIQAGVLAVVDGSFKTQLGQLAIYSSAAEVESLVRRMSADPGYVTRTAMAKARELVLQGLQHAAVRAIERILPGDRMSTEQAVREIKPAVSTVKGADPSEVLFVSSNGVGLGHLTRLMAIARRLERSEPVFLTMSQAFQVVERSGWPVSYLPFHEVADCDVADWNRWLQFEIEQILSRRPLIRTIVFDGSNPYSGLLSAFATTDIRKVWVQRGMWKKGHMNLDHVRRGRLFDLIIEPGDVAESLAAENVDSPAFDKVRTDPIWLLDPDELLLRSDARAALGITEGTRTCLVQLGSGTNRDNVSLLKTIIPALKRQGITPFIAEWLMGSEVPRIWPGVVYLRVFPLAKYFNAFDFCVSAAGYNSFHELIGFRLPTIFIANEHQMMDDQAARARFAMQNDAAIWMKEDAVQEIETAIDLIMREDVRAMMKAALTALAPRNGATEAARIVDILSQGARPGRVPAQPHAPFRIMDAA